MEPLMIGQVGQVNFAVHSNYFLAKAGGRPRTARRKAGHVRWPACGLRRRERVPLRSVRGALSFGTFLWASKEKYESNSRRGAIIAGGGDFWNCCLFRA
jgi:hypothetical protein